MKILTLSVLLALAFPSVGAAAGEGGLVIGNLHIFYVRGSGIKTVADERDRYEKPRNRLGSGLVVLGSRPYVPDVPLPRRKR